MVFRFSHGFESPRVPALKEARERGSARALSSIIRKPQPHQPSRCCRIAVPWTAAAVSHGSRISSHPILSSELWVLWVFHLPVWIGDSQGVLRVGEGLGVGEDQRHRLNTLRQSCVYDFIAFCDLIQVFFLFECSTCTVLEWIQEGEWVWWGGELEIAWD